VIISHTPRASMSKVATSARRWSGRAGSVPVEAVAGIGRRTVGYIQHVSLSGSHNCQGEELDGQWMNRRR
jgi:hypothetical protein